MTIKITEYFGDTQETIERDATKDEVSAHKKRNEKYAELEIAKVAKAAAKSALLEKMGITEDEAKLLLS